MGITTSIRYGLARWLAKAAAVPTLPQWARSSFHPDIRQPDALRL